MAEALAAEPDAIGCWRAWRVPGDGAPLPPAKRVFVVEVGADADLAGITARLQRHLAAAGEASPQVEVYSLDIDLPAYQRLARGCGELVWAAAEDPGMELASIFDEVDPQAGPRFSPDHPRLDADEVGQVAQYLREGEPVLVTTAQMDDVVDPTRQYCVPLNFRTDGTWVWTEACAYYAEQHHLEPDPGLLAHIRSNGHTVPDVDGVALHRALAVLQEPPDAESVWTLGSPPGQDPDTPASPPRTKTPASPPRTKTPASPPRSKTPAIPPRTKTPASPPRSKTPASPPGTRNPSQPTWDQNPGQPTREQNPGEGAGEAAPGQEPGAACDVTGG